MPHNTGRFSYALMQLLFKQLLYLHRVIERVVDIECQLGNDAQLLADNEAELAADDIFLIFNELKNRGFIGAAYRKNADVNFGRAQVGARSEEHTSELQ